MKQWLLLFAAMLVSSTTANAAGVNLAWDNCLGGGGVAHKTFACNSNSGISAFVVSFRAPAGLGSWDQIYAEILFQSAATTLPDWWRLRNETGQTGQCRNGSVGANTLIAGATGCVDPWNNLSAGGVGYYLAGDGAPNRARLLLGAGIPAGDPLIEETEYFAYRGFINNAKTVGLGSCAGCSEGMCIVANWVEIADSPAPPLHLSAPAEQNFIVWQGGDAACPGATPRRNETWGSIKSLYR